MEGGGSAFASTTQLHAREDKFVKDDCIDRKMTQSEFEALDDKGSFDAVLKLRDGSAEAGYFDSAGKWDTSRGRFRRAGKL